MERPKKDRREWLVLLHLIELYIATGHPVGSQTIKEQGFSLFSSATVRNYCAKLEMAGYLKQPHVSGGRVPTPKAFSWYAEQQRLIASIDKDLVEKLDGEPRPEVVLYLQKMAERLSDLTSCAVVLSAPRFDQDFVLDIKWVCLDSKRILAVILTSFGVVRSEVLYSEKEVGPGLVSPLELYCAWRLNKGRKPTLDLEVEGFAAHCYQEVMLRHIVSYAHYAHDDLCRVGFSRLLRHPEFLVTTTLAQGLSLFENVAHLRNFLRLTQKRGELSFWIGGMGGAEEMASLALQECAVIAAPYRINRAMVGAVLLLGPSRLPYPKVYGALLAVVEKISECMTESLHKFKMTYRTDQQDFWGQLGFLEPAQGVLSVSRACLECKSEDIEHRE